MPELLLHSMSAFAEIILDGLDIAGATSIVEIGAEYGGMTQILARHVGDQGGLLTSIDPSAKSEFLAWVAANAHVRHVAEPSLVALTRMQDIDAWLIDGDHNWFTVYNELRLIDGICRRDGKPMLAFLHDIGWPSGRRDMYYAPDQIPAPFCHPHCFDGGALPGRKDLQPGRGFRGMGHFAWARHEGGPRNGVRTAVDDFLRDLGQQGRSMAFAEIPAVFGLGVLFDEDTPWSETLGQHLLPYHENSLIAVLEQNRLDNYLRVIEMQDDASVDSGN